MGPVEVEGVAQGGSGGVDACGGVRSGHPEDSLDGRMVELGVQAAGVDGDQFGQAILGFAQLCRHRRVLVLFQCLAQVAEGELERGVAASVVEHQAAFEGFAEAGAGMVGIEDAEEAGQTGGHRLGSAAGSSVASSMAPRRRAA
ncbi:hypothetical protein SAMN05428954_0014 [Streptomyces sp. 2112.3]|uniref:hypothetical protein n=1 Tax=Streptomyces sp. 2112.3 TaxID=1881023 RepID=UPI00089C467D|nr:hypothetical protein [Streptomyces sp. 2112.3]SED28698.1 hypothetical protein SAMN05428954_0014 [Streptomyces sp. 2112.3]